MACKSLQNRKYKNLHLGFVDAAVLATAEILGVSRIATTDRRDFEVVRASLPDWLRRTVEAIGEALREQGIDADLDAALAALP